MSQIITRRIPMSAEMVRATLRDIDPKIISRRMRGLDKINVNPADWVLKGWEREVTKREPVQHGRMVANLQNFVTGETLAIKCPYGAPGDLLKLTESFVTYKNDKLTDERVKHVTFLDGGQMYKDGVYVPWHTHGVLPKTKWWKQSLYRLWPSIHMPLWASRITTEIEFLRLERLQDITEEDAKAEGVERLQFLAEGEDMEGQVWVKGTYREAFIVLFAHLNGPDPWERNVWVWVIGFKRLTS